MNAPHHGFDTFFTIDGRDFVSPWRCAGKSGQSDQVGGVIPERLEIFIYDLDFPVTRGQRGDDPQSQRLVARGAVDEESAA